MHERLIDLATSLLGTDDLRVYSIEAWAKYTGAADYDQPLHRDYLNHSLLVPSPDQPPQQVEMFVYLTDVPAQLGPPSYVPTAFTAELRALPNWYPREAGADPEGGWVATAGSQELYEAEVRAAGPAAVLPHPRLHH